MSLRRLRHGEWLAGVGGVVLLFSLFTSWYGASVDVGGGGVELSAGFSAWRSFDVVDLLLALLALLAIGLAVLQATQTGPALPVGAAVLTSAFGLLCVLVVVYRLVDRPGPNEFIDVRSGAWLGLAATVAIAAGGWLALRDERARHVPPGPEPELRRAPQES